MKNKIITTSLIILSSFAYAQENNNKILVEYTSTEGTVMNKERLLATQDKAIYITDSLYIKFKKNENIIKEDEETNSLTIRTNTIKFDANIYYIRLDSDVIFFNKEMDENIVTVKDSIPKLVWELIPEETKKINNFICNKAILNYRGSKLIAYYTNEIPISFGPWKFKGLPGLILEIYNVSGDMFHHWVADKIVYPFENDKKTNFTISKEKEVVDLKTYIEYMENKIRKLMRISDSRTPKGVTVATRKLNRIGIEKVYEWEQ
tara:strand:+ start:21388 stop:22173 length:786 start_codon:yes stop_codon:yes gene_type:complete